MSEKRFYLDEEDRLCIHYDGEILASVGFKETEAIKIVDMLNQLKEEIRAYPINEQYAEEIMQQNQKLRIERNDLRRENKQLQKENEQLKSLVDACKYGQKNLMEEMKYNDEALDKIWEIMKELYGVIDE